MNLKIIYAIILASLYTAIVSYGLWISNGIPYSYDNNESYSSLIHASSISNFGIGESKGLADEAYGKSSAAHPFVHSHQGNYPRIYAWFLYELGATSVETQVLITTMTIGLISILLLYFFIANLSTPWLGLICALVFITDYIFFLQWQFVTYRVWYSFVFFLQFNAIEKYLKKNDKIWLFILFLNTTLFYYGELIYAAFLGLASCLWVVLRSFRHYKILIQLLITMALGLVVAVGILVIQGIEYLGFEIFLEDLKLTFLSRNDVNNVNVVEVKKFYKDNNIVFWENMENRRAFIGFLPFLNSIFLSFIQLNGPVVFLVLAAPLIIYFALKIQFKFKYWSRTDKLSFGNNIWGEGGRYILYSFLFSVPIYFGQVLVFQYGGSTHLSLNLIWMLVVLIVTIVLLALRFIDYSVIFVYCNSTVLIGLLVFYISKVTDLSYSSYWLAGEEVGAHRYLSF